MLPRDYRERARRVLETGRHESLLGPRAGLCWRTHDYGLLVFGGHRLSEACQRELRLLLGGEGHGGSRRGGRLRAERCALPLAPLYAFAAAGLACQADPEADGGLPGGGCLVERGGAVYGLSADPEAFLQELVRLEEAGREAVLGRLLGGASPAPPALRPAEESAAPGSCGRCGGLLGGGGQCMGGACARHG